jgi:hydrogenase expression/formation protein HypE
MDLTQEKKVVLDHGTGAKLSRELVEMIVSVLDDVYIGEMEDSAMLTIHGERIAVTTDSFVVDPLFFGNGDIGKIAVCGTVNDLSVVGATAKYLTLALIIEAGFPFEHLKQVLESIRDTAREAKVKIVAGDTKVVNTGEADKLFINTTGIGVFNRPPLRMKNVKAGDKVILSGPIGNHAVHLLSIREGLGFETKVLSDCAPLNNMIEDLFTEVGHDKIRSIRDVTRGGLSAVLHEYSRAVNHAIQIMESSLPIQHETVMATDMLGINALDLANEGCLCLFVPPENAGAVLNALRKHRYGVDAVEIGEILDQSNASVVMITAAGHTQQIEELEGSVLPRLC